MWIGRGKYTRGETSQEAFAVYNVGEDALGWCWGRGDAVNGEL